MGRLAKNQVPKRRHHRASDRDVVTLSGKDFYLGPHDSEEAIAKYNRLVSSWVANGRKLSEAERGGDLPVTVAGLCSEFLRHSEGYYRKDGAPTSEHDRLTRVARMVVSLFGPLPARDFGPLALKAVRQAWIQRGCARTVVNKYVREAILIFSWGVENELIPKEMVYGLREIMPLKKGRTVAPESDGVGPAPAESVAKLLEVVRPVIANMIRLQLLTAMRPGEVCRMRPSHIERGAESWIYRPPLHKMEHKGRKREIYLGPKCRAILGPILDKRAKEKSNAPLFEPRGQAGKAYRPARYGTVIRQFCDRRGVPRFAPNQLRHTALTAIRQKFGLETARIVAGHSESQTTEIYAKPEDWAKLNGVASDYS